MSAIEQDNKPNLARQRKAKQRLVSIIMLAAFVAIVLPATGVLIAIGMLPTFVSVLTERRHRDMAALSVGSLNAVGLLPPLFDLWRNGHTVSNAFDVLFEPFSLLFILGASAVGSACYHGLPQMIEAAMTYQGQRSLRRYRGTQERILEEWGQSILDRKAMVKVKKPALD